MLLSSRLCPYRPGTIFHASNLGKRIQARGDAPKESPRLVAPGAWSRRSGGVGIVTGPGYLRPGSLGFFGLNPCLLGTLGRANDKGDHRAADHDDRDDVEGEGVGICGVYDAGDQQRPEHAAEAPGRQHQAVVRPDVRRPEVVRVERRHRPEPTAVAGDYDEGEHGQQEVRADQRQQEEEHRLQDEHREEYPFAAYGVREPGPEEPPESVGDRDDADQAGGDSRVDAGDLLRHRRGLRDDGDAGSHVQEQECPQRVPLPGPQDLAQAVVHARAVAALGRVGLPALRLPALRGVSHEQRRAHYHDQIDDAEDGKSREYPDRRDEIFGYKRRHEGAAAEARHGDARDEAPFVGEPLDQGGHRNDVAEADPDAAQKPVRQVEQSEAVRGEARQEDPEPVEHTRADSHDAGPRPVHPQSTEEGREPEGQDSDAKRDVGGGHGGAVLLRQRIAEDAPGVHRPEGDLHHHPRDGYYPPIANVLVNCLACHATPPFTDLRSTEDSPSVPLCSETSYSFHLPLPYPAIELALRLTRYIFPVFPGTNPVKPGVYIKSVTTQETDERHVEPSAHVHRQAARRGDRAHDGHPGHEALLQDLEAAAAADHDDLGAQG